MVPWCRDAWSWPFLQIYLRVWSSPTSLVLERARQPGPGKVGRAGNLDWRMKTSDSSQTLNFTQFLSVWNIFYMLSCFEVCFLERYSADHNRVIESAFRTGVGCLACVVFVQRSNGCWCSWSWNPRLRKQTSLLEFAATKFSSKVPPCMESRQGDVRFQAATWECDGE